ARPRSPRRSVRGCCRHRRSSSYPFRRDDAARHRVGTPFGGEAEYRLVMATPISSQALLRAPKVLLHDPLDRGPPPATVLDLAAESGYQGLPSTDAAELGAWFRDAADSGSLERYLETFAHTVGVMQTETALKRVAAECAEDLAADGVVYAEVRFAPELHLEQ